MTVTLVMIPAMLFFCLIVAVSVYVVYLVIKALRKYTKSAPVRKEKAENAKTLGEVLKQNNRCEPAGSFQMGKRCIRPQHNKSDRTGKAV